MELTPWQTKLLEKWKDSSIESLLDEVLEIAGGDYFNECQFMVKLLKERIGNLREDAYEEGRQDALRKELGE